MAPMNSSSSSSSNPTKERYIALRSFLSLDEQEAITKEAFGCHYDNSDCGKNSFAPLVTSKTSVKLELNIPCGAGLNDRLPLAVSLCRRAFVQAQEILKDDSLELLADSSLSIEEQRLTGLALLYGPNGNMTSHYDAPTQPGQRHEWLAMLTVGNAVEFCCNDDILILQSGDALVMDSMAVLHGVQGIVGTKSDSLSSSAFSLPIQGSRLGILMWQAAARVSENAAENEQDDDTVDLEGVNMLFPDSSSDEDDE